MVVGGGSAGCALAGRLAAARAGRVLLLEAGPVEWAPEILDVASLAATAPGHRANWGHPVELRTGSAAAIPRGRVLGGSGAVNGAVWMRATPADGWDQPGWTWAEMLARYVRSESDADLGGSPGHGVDGPVPVARPAGALRHPAADRFLAAAAACGFPAETDKNAGGAPGAGLVPGNAVDGVRVNPAMAYLRDLAALPLGSGRLSAADRHAHGPRRQPGGARRARRHPGRRRPAHRRHHGARGRGRARGRLRRHPAPAPAVRDRTGRRRCVPPASTSGTTWPASVAASPTTPPSSCRSPPPTRRRTRTPGPPRPRSTSMRAPTRRATARCCSSRALSSPAVPCTSCAS